MSFPSRLLCKDCGNSKTACKCPSWVDGEQPHVGMVTKMIDGSPHLMLAIGFAGKARTFSLPVEETAEGNAKVCAALCYQAAMAFKELAGPTIIAPE